MIECLIFVARLVGYGMESEWEHLRLKRDEETEKLEKFAQNERKMELQSIIFN